MSDRLRASRVIPLLVTALIAAALLGAVCGYVWYESQKTEETVYSGPCDPRIPLTTFTDNAWGYSISYPQSWFVESYGPLENPALSAAPEDATPEDIPFFMAAIATLDGNFDPQYSDAGEVARIFLVRGPSQLGSYEDFVARLQQDSDEGDLGLVYDAAPILINGLSGFTMETTENGGTPEHLVFLNAPGFTYEIRAYPYEDAAGAACLPVLRNIQDSFRLESKEVDDE